MARHPSFRAADVHTGFIPQHFDTLFPALSVDATMLTQAAAALVVNELSAAHRNAKGGAPNPFVIEAGMRLNHDGIRNFKLKFNNVG